MHGKLHIQKAKRTPGFPNHINYYFLRLTVWIIIWERCICLFINENAKGIVYPKGPKTFGPPNHISYCILGYGGLDRNLGEIAYAKGTQEFWSPKHF